MANVSHELRTPIFAIQGYIETLLSGAVNDKKVNLHFLHKANQNTLSLSNLLNDLIDISMIESGEMRMSYRFFKISDLINEIIQANKKIAEDKIEQLKEIVMDHVRQEESTLFSAIRNNCSDEQQKQMATQFKTAKSQIQQQMAASMK